MDELVLLFLLFFLLLAFYTHSIQFSTKKMPPGPPVVPFGLGSMPAAWLMRPFFKPWTFRAWEYFDMIAKKYGDVFSVSFANFQAVVINSYEAHMEMAPADEYSIKYANKHYTYPRTFGKELGIIFVGSPPRWMEMRKFTQRTLRTFGFGKQYTMQSVITEEANLISEDFSKTIEKTNGIVKFHNTWSLTVLNVLWCMVAGKRYSHDDPWLVKLTQRAFYLSKITTFANPIETIIPFLGNIAPWMFPNFHVGFRYKMFDEIHHLSRTLVLERKAEGFYISEPQSYVDVFLKKIEDHKNDKDTLYTEEQLLAMLADLLLVGSLTSNATLNYAILFLIRNPEIQKQIQDEIDSVVPMAVAPTMEEIKKMPYFQAFILETHRCANVVPIPIPRIVPQDWTFRGYRIPKNTLIFSNHYGINVDEKNWGDPKTFRPARFINENGVFVHDPRVTAFGFGKRLCIGITLVDTIIPIMLAILLQKFNFAVVPGKEPPTTEPEIGLSLSPIAFEALMTHRKR